MSNSTASKRIATDVTLQTIKSAMDTSNTKDEARNTLLGQIVAGIHALAGGSFDFSDWRNISAMIRSGNVDKVPLGAIFKVTHSVFGDLYFITRARNQHPVSGEPTRPTVTIQSLYLLSLSGSPTTAKTFVYDRKEAFYSVTEAIPANTVCKFTTIEYGGWAAGTWNFTATAQIAAGSKLCISAYQDTALGSCKVQVFTDAKQTTPAAEYSISSGAGSATKDLGTWGTDCNHPQRVSYGSNNEKESNFFQWLNSDAASFPDQWQPQTKFDMLDGGYAGMAGFLAGFPEDFRGALGLCAIPNVSNGVFESPDSAVHTNQKYEHNGYFFLPSRKEIYGSNESSYEADEVQFDYYKNVGTADRDKLMYAKGATGPTTYWLRTPDAGSAIYVRICYTGSGGALHSNDAFGADGAAPLAILA